MAGLAGVDGDDARRLVAVAAHQAHLGGIDAGGDSGVKLEFLERHLSNFFLVRL